MTNDAELKRQFVLAVYDERGRQDEEHGGPIHDDQHCQEDWREYVAYQIQKTQDFERCMVKVAALAMAAFESNRRKHGTDSRQR